MNPEREKELFERLKSHAIRVDSLKEHCDNEEQTKISLINPYLEHLGFDVRDPRKVKLEYRADIGHGTERVDYAVLVDGAAVLLIEAKSTNVQLPLEPTGQLRRYAMALPSVQYAALTNGLIWHWYMKSSQSSDLHTRPFLIHDASNPRSEEIPWLSTLVGGSTVEDWSAVAAEAGLRKRISDWFNDQKEEPSNEFLATIIKGIGERNSHQTRERVANLWSEVVHMQEEILISARLERARTPMEEPDIVSAGDDTDTVPDGGEIDSPEDSRQFDTVEGPQTLITSGLKRAWKWRAQEFWHIEQNMSIVCLTLLRELAKIHDNSSDSFYESVLNDFGNPGPVMRTMEVSTERGRQYSILEGEWSFKTNANNDQKLDWVKRAAGNSTVHGQKVDFDAYFEVWNPVNPSFSRVRTSDEA